MLQQRRSLMITEAKELSIVIEFEQDDWRNGLARHMMDGIKKLPYLTRKYSGEDKKWYISATQRNRRSLQIMYEDWEDNLPFHWKSEKDQEYVEEFLEQFN